jgi:hypothetical protein
VAGPTPPGSTGTIFRVWATFLGQRPTAGAKLANIVFTRELARRMGPGGLWLRPCTPGSSIAISHRTGTKQCGPMAAADKVLPEEPAETLVWLANDPKGGWAAGRLLSPG